MPKRIVLYKSLHFLFLWRQTPEKTSLLRTAPISYCRFILTYKVSFPNRFEMFFSQKKSQYYGPWAFSPLIQIQFRQNDCRRFDQGYLCSCENKRITGKTSFLLLACWTANIPLNGRLVSRRAEIKVWLYRKYQIIA